MLKSKTAASAASRVKYLYPKTVKGIDYLYFRMPPKGTLIPLPADRDSAEFNKAYDACMAELKRQRKGAAVEEPIAPGIKCADTRIVEFVGDTIGAAIKVYRASPEYEAIKPSSKRVYDIALEQIASALGTGRLRDLDTDAVDLYSGMVTKHRGAATADKHIALLSNIWQVCRPHKQFNLTKLANPTRDAKTRYTKAKKPHKPWPEHVQEDFMRTAPEHLKQAKLLLHFSAQRGGDCVKMRWSHFDGEGLLVIPEKGDDLEMANWHKCPAPLLAMLKKLQRERNPEPEDFILLNAKGRPWASSGDLSYLIRLHLTKIGHRQKGERTYSMHGLRKNAASEVGELLKGTAGIKSVTGHRSNEMAEFYAKHASQIAMNREVVEAWDAKLAKALPKLKRVK
jgi:integrase